MADVDAKASCQERSPDKLFSMLSSKAQMPSWCVQMSNVSVVEVARAHPPTYRLRLHVEKLMFRGF